MEQHMKANSSMTKKTEKESYNTVEIITNTKALYWDLKENSLKIEKFRERWLIKTEVFIKAH